MIWTGKYTDYTIFKTNQLALILSKWWESHHETVEFLPNKDWSLYNSCILQATVLVLLLRCIRRPRNSWSESGCQWVTRPRPEGFKTSSRIREEIILEAGRKVIDLVVIDRKTF